MPSIRLDFSWKYLLNVLIGMCVVVLALLPITIPPDHLTWIRWQCVTWGAAILAIVGLFVQAASQSREDDKRDKRENERDERLKRVMGFIETNAPPKGQSANPVVEPNAAQDSMYVELHYTFLYPKVGDLAFQLLEGKFKADGRKPEDVTTDCDLLVDIYAVNRTTSSLYVKDFAAWLQIGGDWRTLTLDDNFHLDDIWSGSVEYGLENPGHPGEFDHYPSELPSLLSKRNTEIKPQEPIEGWLKFTAKDVNPRTEYSIRLAIIDSLGIEHHLDRFEKKQRAIGLRKVKG